MVDYRKKIKQPKNIRVYRTYNFCLSDHSHSLLQSCDLVLDIHSPQPLVDLVQDPLTLEAAAPAVQTGHDDAVWADQHRVPAQREALAHRLATGGAVSVEAQDERMKKTHRIASSRIKLLELNWAIVWVEGLVVWEITSSEWCYCWWCFHAPAAKKCEVWGTTFIDPKTPSKWLNQTIKSADWGSRQRPEVILQTVGYPELIRENALNVSDFE